MCKCVKIRKKHNITAKLLISIFNQSQPYLIFLHYTINLTSKLIYFGHKFRLIIAITVHIKLIIAITVHINRDNRIVLFILLLLLILSCLIIWIINLLWISSLFIWFNPRCSFRHTLCSYIVLLYLVLYLLLSFL